MLIHKSLLLATMPATTDKDQRYFMDAVRVEPTGTVVATNGHILIKATDANPTADEDFPQVATAPFHGNIAAPVLVSTDICKRLIAAMPKRDTLPVLHTVQVGRNGSDSTAQLTVTDLNMPVSVTISEADTHSFPAYERVFPNPTRAAVTIRLGVPVLQALLKSAKAIDASSIRFDLPTEKTYHEKGTTEVAGAIQATYGKDGIECLAVLMPVRA
jgi:hypothetical protein